MGKGVPGRHRPYSRGGDRVLIALDDELFGNRELRDQIVRVARFRSEVEIVPASAFDDPAAEADLWLGAPPRPTAPGREVLFTTEAKELYEQDEKGLVWMTREGKTDLVFDVQPLRVGNPRTMQQGPGSLAFLHEAAILFAAPAPDKGQSMTRVRIRTTGYLTNLWREPRTATANVPEDLRDWLASARRSREPVPPDPLAALRQRR
jgi:hypothetical protein